MFGRMRRPCTLYLLHGGRRGSGEAFKETGAFIIATLYAAPAARVLPYIPSGTCLQLMAAATTVRKTSPIFRFACSVFVSRPIAAHVQCSRSLSTTSAGERDQQVR